MWAPTVLRRRRSGHERGPGPVAGGGTDKDLWPAGGLLRTFRAEGDVVAEGDVLAAVSDPFGAGEEEIVAPGPGLLIGRAVMPVVHDGDALFHLAELSPQADADSALALAAQLEADPLFDEDEII